MTLDQLTLDVLVPQRLIANANRLCEVGQTQPHVNVLDECLHCGGDEDRTASILLTCLGSTSVLKINLSQLPHAPVPAEEIVDIQLRLLIPVP